MVSLAPAASAAGEPDTFFRIDGQTMGSTYSVTLIARDSDEDAVRAFEDEIEAYLAALDQQISTYRDGTEIRRFNASLSTNPFPVSAEFAGLVREALDIARETDGAFDITLLPLLELWGFAGGKPQVVPPDRELERVRAWCGLGRVRVTASHELVKARPEVRITLNALAAGYAADQIAARAARHGWTNVFIDVGGEILARGCKPGGAAWRAGVTEPRLGAGVQAPLLTAVQVRDRAVATSGDYRNFFTNAEGTVYSHIFDPRTGRPATSHVASVSVFAPTAARADAYATALFVLGPDAGLAWTARHPGIDALYVLRGTGGAFRTVATPGATAALTP